MSVAKSKKLEQKLAELQAELAAAREQEREAAERELIRLVTRAGVLDDALVWARGRVDRKRGGQQQ